MYVWLLVSLLVATSPDARSEFAANPRSAERPRCSSHLGEEFNRDPDDAQNGLVTRSLPLTVGNVLEAYPLGVFPWGEGPDGNAEWYSPPNRGVLDLANFSVGDLPKSDRKFIERNAKSGEYRVTFDEDFEGVINACAKQARYLTQGGTGLKVPSTNWITPAFIRTYIELHRRGVAHSVEVRRGGHLVAGLYGIFIRGMFSGESMFHDRVYGANATKLAYVALIERLRKNGHRFIDTQMSVGLSAKWGGHEIPREVYLQILQDAQADPRPY